MKRSFHIAVAGGLVAAALYAQQPDKREVPQGYHLENSAKVTGEEIPREASVVASVPAAAVPARPARGAVTTDGDLSAGRIEIKAFGGINYSYGRPSLAPRVPPSFGGEIGFGVASFAAVTGEYAYNQIGTLRDVQCGPLGCVRPDEGGSMQDALIGARLFVPRLSVTPYGSLGFGLAHLSAGSTNVAILSGATPASSGDKFAIASGGGVEFKIGRQTGVALDIKAVRPMQFHWYIRATLGFFLRFR